MQGLSVGLDEQVAQQIFLATVPKGVLVIVDHTGTFVSKITIQEVPKMSPKSRRFYRHGGNHENAIARRGRGKAEGDRDDGRKVLQICKDRHLTVWMGEVLMLYANARFNFTIKIHRAIFTINDTDGTHYNLFITFGLC